MTTLSYAASQTALAGDQHATSFTFIYNLIFVDEIEDWDAQSKVTSVTLPTTTSPNSGLYLRDKVKFSLVS